MKDIHEKNRHAWEEAYDNASPGFLERTERMLKTNPRGLFSKELDEALQALAAPGKTLGQFCSNNGRETMAALAYGFSRAVGFDITRNMTDAANRMANDLGLEASFVQTDILELEGYGHAFDVLLVTVGALTWFKDLDAFFAVASRVVKPGGTVLIEEVHPLSNMLAIEGEEGYDSESPRKIVHSYFKDDPWVEEDGMGYMTGQSGISKPFVSYSHTFSEILNGLSKNGFALEHLTETDIDSAGMFETLSGKGYPLTYVLVSKRSK
jgi:ubiquinone/menaquinone biosynthesis C-methylase UbiE